MPANDRRGFDDEDDGWEERIFSEPDAFRSPGDDDDEEIEEEEDEDLDEEDLEEEDIDDLELDEDE
jgi:hypothetical protein